MIAFIVLCRSAVASPWPSGSPPQGVPTLGIKPSWHPHCRETWTAWTAAVSSSKSEKTCMKQAESAQNKHTANEDESFKLGMACSSIGPVFPRPMLATSPTSSLRRKHCSVSAAGVRQRGPSPSRGVSTAVVWYGMKFLPADRSSAWGRCFSPQSPGRKWIHSLAPSNSHCWLFIYHHKLKIKNHMRL